MSTIVNYSILRWRDETEMYTIFSITHRIENTARLIMCVTFQISISSQNDTIGLFYDSTYIVEVLTNCLMAEIQSDSSSQNERSDQKTL